MNKDLEEGEVRQTPQGMNGSQQKPQTNRQNDPVNCNFGGSYGIDKRRQAPASTVPLKPKAMQASESPQPIIQGPSRPNQSSMVVHNVTRQPPTEPNRDKEIRELQKLKDVRDKLLGPQQAGTNVPSVDWQQLAKRLEDAERQIDNLKRERELDQQQKLLEAEREIKQLRFARELDRREQDLNEQERREQDRQEWYRQQYRQRSPERREAHPYRQNWGEWTQGSSDRRNSRDRSPRRDDRGRGRSRGRGQGLSDRVGRGRGGKASKK